MATISDALLDYPLEYEYEAEPAMINYVEPPAKPLRRVAPPKFTVLRAYLRVWQKAMFK